MTVTVYGDRPPGATGSGTPVTVTPTSAVTVSRILIAAEKFDVVPVGDVAVALRNWPAGTPPVGMNREARGAGSVGRHVELAEERLALGVVVAIAGVRGREEFQVINGVGGAAGEGSRDRGRRGRCQLRERARG